MASSTSLGTSKGWHLQSPGGLTCYPYTLDPALTLDPLTPSPATPDSPPASWLPRRPSSPCSWPPAPGSPSAESRVQSRMKVRRDQIQVYRLGWGSSWSHRLLNTANRCTHTWQSTVGSSRILHPSHPLPSSTPRLGLYLDELGECLVVGLLQLLLGLRQLRHLQTHNMRSYSQRSGSGPRLEPRVASNTWSGRCSVHDEVLRQRSIFLERSPSPSI